MDETNSKSTIPPPPTSPSNTPDGATPAIDKTFYTWSNFFSILTGFSSDSDRQKYLHTRDMINEKEDCATCEKNKKWLFKHSPLITFLKTEIDALGPGDGSASISEKNVRCRRCGSGDGQQGHGQSGGFSPDHGILLCANKLRNKGHLEDTLAHEMVHAYDHMRFKLDPYDLRHAACMEIRASTLSGECRFSREFFTRGQWSLTQQLQECVRRRAALSVAGRPGCRDDVQAARVVNEVWESCFGDWRPFDEIYR